MDLLQFRQRREELERQVSQLTEGQVACDDPDAPAQTPGAAGSAGAQTSYKQLRLAIQELAVAEDKLHAQNEQLLASKLECESERQRYGDLFHFCPDAYLVTDARGSILEANKAAQNLAGESELIGREIASLIEPEAREAFRQQLREIPNLGRVEDLHITLNPTGGGAGAPRPASATVQVGSHHDQPLQFRWLLRDLTAAQQTEREMQRLREQIRRSEQLSAIGTLAAGLGHDVKNLLFPMRCRLESLAKQDLPDEAADDLQGVRHSLQYLQQLAANLQLLAEKPDPSKMMRGTTEIKTWWDHVAPLMSTATPARARLEGNFEEDLPPVSIAPHQLTQAVMNLVNNAGEAVPDNGVVTVWAKPARHGPFVKIGVSDNGPGMTPEVLRRALDPFFTTKERSRGLSTGMGLSLVRGIIKSVGGSIRIDSVPNEGTSVVLRVPIAVEPARERVQQPENLPHAAISVSDAHLASTLCTLLNLSRLPAWRVDAHDPGDAALWIAEPDATPVELARAYLAARDDRRLVLFGTPSDAWNDVPATWIEPTASLRTIRDALSDVALVLLQSR